MISFLIIEFSTFCFSLGAFSYFDIFPAIMEIIDVRRASPKDCHEIRKLIQELADYEKKPEGPKYEASGT